MNKVHLVFGPQGAGKTTYSQSLSKKVNGVHLSIDDWMWKLYGEDLPKPMNLRWIMERVARCEEQIWATSEKIFKCGGTVILDLAFTKRAKRELFLSLTEKIGAHAELHYVNAPHGLRKKRVLNRNVEQGDSYSFEVTSGMFDFMETEFDWPTESELVGVVTIDTGSMKI